MQTATKRITLTRCLSILLVTACQGDLHAKLDILPQRYPNRLASADQELEAVLFSPPNAVGIPTSPRAIARALHTNGGEASALADVTGSVAFRDVNADGQPDAVARFAVADMQRLLGPRSHTIVVRIEGSDLNWVGDDRLFAPDTPLIELPAPSGPDGVGTAALLAHDATRPGPTENGRALLVRFWYPAQASDVQPAPYFLDAERAAQNLASGPFPLPADLFELTHGSARPFVAPAAATPRPVLLLSTGWGAPVELYSALAEDFASHGYLVLGVNHPNGSGAIVYPDGSDPGLDPATIHPDERNNADWALDLERLADWVAEGGGALEPVGIELDLAAHTAVRAALARADGTRIAALGHSFGGSAAVRADAESLTIRASANLDGPIVGDATTFARSANALWLLSPAHSELDVSIRKFAEALGGEAHCYAVDGTLHANYGDTGWLFERLLEENPDLQREGYGLGSIAPERAHRVVSGVARDFFEAAFTGRAAPALAEVRAAYPEVTPW
jgi:predicted dienelactone hydrolase